MTQINLRLTDIENRLVVAKREGKSGRDGVGFGISSRKLLYIEWRNSKILRYSTGNYIQYPLIETSLAVQLLRFCTFNEEGADWSWNKDLTCLTA